MFLKSMLTNIQLCQTEIMAVALLYFNELIFKNLYKLIILVYCTRIQYTSTFYTHTSRAVATIKAWRQGRTVR